MNLAIGSGSIIAECAFVRFFAGMLPDVFLVVVSVATYFTAVRAHIGGLIATAIKQCR